MAEVKTPLRRAVFSGEAPQLAGLLVQDGDAGEEQLKWCLQEIYGKTRTVCRATAADASLLYVQSDSLKIDLMPTLNNFPDTMSSRPSGLPDQFRPEQESRSAQVQPKRCPSTA